MCSNCASLHSGYGKCTMNIVYTVTNVNDLLKHLTCKISYILSDGFSGFGAS